MLPGKIIGAFQKLPWAIFKDHTSLFFQVGKCSTQSVRRVYADDSQSCLCVCYQPGRTQLVGPLYVCTWEQQARQPEKLDDPRRRDEQHED